MPDAVSKWSSNSFNVPPSEPPTSQMVPLGGKANDERIDAAEAAVNEVIPPSNSASASGRAVK
eukprot:scaffold4388_cov66-Phaeocystis_antarctica.AAC.2